MLFLWDLYNYFFIWYNRFKIIGGDTLSYNIYLVEDDKNLNLVLRSYLEKEGWHVESFLRGEDALKYLNNPPDLWILDIMLPDISGYELIRSIRAKDDTPVIFISARDQDIDRVLGLELGSDDYLAKPFLPRELVIRIKNLLGRRNPLASQKKLGPYEISLDSRVVILEGQEIDLTSKEYDLLLLFMKNINIALSREQILDHIWGLDYFGSDRVVDDLVRRLRSKMPRLNIETIYGYGYKVAKV